MLPLQYGRAWLAAGCLLLAVALTIALLPGSAVALVVYDDKLTHLLGFAALMIWFCGLFRFRYTPLLAVALTAYGGLIELMQGFTTTRQPEIADLYADGAGILLGWALCAAGLRWWCVRVEAWLTPR